MKLENLTENERTLLRAINATLKYLGPMDDLSDAGVTVCKILLSGIEKFQANVAKNVVGEESVDESLVKAN